MTLEARNAAIENLYVEHHAWLVSWLQRRLKLGFEAADLAQDTFVRLLRRDAEATLAVAEPRALLSTIARGVAVDHLRAENVRRAYIEAMSGLSEPQMPSPEQRLMLLQTLTRIDALLSALKPNVRAAFLMSRLDGLTYPNIAERLGVSLSSVEKYMVSALRHCWQMRQQVDD